MDGLDWRNAYKEIPEEEGLFLVAIYMENGEPEIRLVIYMKGMWVETNHFLVVENPDLWAKVKKPGASERYV